MKKIFILLIALYLFSFKFPVVSSVYACAENGVHCSTDADCCSNACVETKVIGTGPGAVSVNTKYCGTVEEKATGKTIETGSQGGTYDTTPEEKDLLTPPCKQMGDKDNTYFDCDTGLGITISSSPKDFVRALFGIILSISGGIALLLIIFSGYRLIASRGNPEKITDAKDRLTSAVIGLLFIIFSLVILQIIGVDILHIREFSP